MDLSSSSSSSSTPYLAHSNTLKYVIASNPSDHAKSTQLAELLLDTGNESYTALRRGTIQRLGLPRLKKTAGIQDASGVTDELPMYGPVELLLPRTPQLPFGRRMRLSAVVEIDDALDNIMGVKDMSDNHIAVQPLPGTDRYHKISTIMRESTSSSSGSSKS